MSSAATTDRSFESHKFRSAMNIDELKGKADDTFLSSERKKQTVGTLDSVSDLPFIDYANTVEFHILLSSLPFDTNPTLAKLFSQISDGTELPSFHVGLGVWDTFTDTKISIEFIPDNLLTTLLPTLNEKKTFLQEAVENDYILYFEHDPVHECCKLQATEKGIRQKDCFRLEDV